jgi:hypothetical protein
MKTITIFERLITAALLTGVSVPGVLSLPNLDSTAPLNIWIAGIATVICCPVLAVIAMWHAWPAEPASDAARGRASVISLAVLAVLGVALYGFRGWRRVGEDSIGTFRVPLSVSAVSSFVPG